MNISEIFTRAHTASHVVSDRKGLLITPDKGIYKLGNRFALGDPLSAFRQSEAELQLEMRLILDSRPVAAPLQS